MSGERHPTLWGGCRGEGAGGGGKGGGGGWDWSRGSAQSHPLGQVTSALQYTFANLADVTR